MSAADMRVLFAQIKAFSDVSQASLLSARILYLKTNISNDKHENNFYSKRYCIAFFIVPNVNENVFGSRILLSFLFKTSKLIL